MISFTVYRDDFLSQNIDLVMSFERITPIFPPGSQPDGNEECAILSLFDPITSTRESDNIGMYYDIHCHFSHWAGGGPFGALCTAPVVGFPGWFVVLNNYTHKEFVCC